MSAGGFSLVDVILDEDLSECVTILRSSGGTWAAGGWQSTITEIPTAGTITIADAESLSMIPEGDRVTGSLMFCCPIPIYETLVKQPPDGTPAISDEIKWGGHRYRVQSVLRWGRYGFWAAILVRKAGS